MTYNSTNADLPNQMFGDAPPQPDAKPLAKTDSTTEKKDPLDHMQDARLRVRSAMHWLALDLTQKEIDTCVLIVACIQMQAEEQNEKK